MENKKQDFSEQKFSEQEFSLQESYNNSFIIPNKSIMKSISQKWNVMKVMVGLLQQSKHLIKHSFKHKKIYFSVILFLMYFARKKFKATCNSKKEVVPEIFENQRVKVKDQTNEYINVLEQFQKGIKIPKPTDLFNQFFYKKTSSSVNNSDSSVNNSNKQVNNSYKLKEISKKEEVREPMNEKKNNSDKTDNYEKKKDKPEKIDNLDKENDKNKIIQEKYNSDINKQKEFSLQENERYVLEKYIKLWEEPIKPGSDVIFQQYFIYEKNKYYRFNMDCLFSDVSDVKIILYKMKTGEYESASFETFSMNGNGIQSNKKDEELYPFTFVSDFMYFNENGKMMIEFIFSPLKKDIHLEIKNINLKVVEHPIIGNPKISYYFMTYHNEKKKFALPVYLRSANLFLEEKKPLETTIKDLF